MPSDAELEHIAARAERRIAAALMAGLGRAMRETELWLGELDDLLADHHTNHPHHPGCCRPDRAR